MTSTLETETTSQARSERINMRVTGEDASLIRQAAAARRMTMTEFLVTAGVAEARRTLDEDRRLAVIGEVYDRLAAEIEEPGQVVDAMVELLKRPRRLQMPSAED